MGENSCRSDCLSLRNKCCTLSFTPLLPSALLRLSLLLLSPLISSSVALSCLASRLLSSVLLVLSSSHFSPLVSSSSLFSPCLLLSVTSSSVLTFSSSGHLFSLHTSTPILPLLFSHHVSLFTSILFLSSSFYLSSHPILPPLLFALALSPPVSPLSPPFSLHFSPITLSLSLQMPPLHCSPFTPLSPLSSPALSVHVLPSSLLLSCVSFTFNLSLSLTPLLTTHLLTFPDTLTSPPCSYPVSPLFFSLISYFPLSPLLPLCSFLPFLTVFDLSPSSFLFSPFLTSSVTSFNLYCSSHLLSSSLLLQSFPSFSLLPPLCTSVYLCLFCVIIALLLILLLWSCFLTSLPLFAPIIFSSLIVLSLLLAPCVCSHRPPSLLTLPLFFSLPISSFPHLSSSVFTPPHSLLSFVHSSSLLPLSLHLLSPSFPLLHHLICLLFSHLLSSFLLPSLRFLSCLLL